MTTHTAEDWKRCAFACRRVIGRLALSMGEAAGRIEGLLANLPCDVEAVMKPAEVKMLREIAAKLFRETQEMYVKDPRKA